MEANGQTLDHDYDWRAILLGPRDTIYEEEIHLFLLTEQSIKTFSLWANMEIGQCSGNAPPRHFNYE